MLTIKKEIKAFLLSVSENLLPVGFKANQTSIKKIYAKRPQANQDD